MTLATLHDKIQTKEAVVAVIGLGYVGLPVACMFAQAGFKTIGLDIDAERVAQINQGKNPIEGIEPGLDDLVAQVTENHNLQCTSHYDELKQADVITISVQTPVDDDHLPRYEHMKSALTALGNVLKQGALVIIESTISPRTMQTIIQETLEASSGMRLNEDFYLGHCPERVMPGRLLYNIENMSRVIGGSLPEVADVMVSFYRNIVKGDLDPTDLLTAELVKTTENAYRDVQIAFANEVAKICEVVGGDVWKLRELVNKSPGRNMLYPGAGVGGHCIPKDPWLLISGAQSISPTLIPSARVVNSGMPAHVWQLTSNSLENQGKTIATATIAVLGYAYLENSDDTRNSPSADFVQYAQTAGANLRIHDPFIEAYATDLSTVLQGADAIVILVAHNQYKEADWNTLLNNTSNQIIVDARHVIPTPEQIEHAQVIILGKYSNKRTKKVK